MTDDLGMKCRISRRDFLQASAVGTLLPSFAGADGPTDYPPLKTGLRGSHEGSYEQAHALSLNGKSDWPASEGSEAYDLIVVGGGVSGLASAYYYRDRHPAARILILDNHDDFGGHAKRNEFMVDGHHLIGYGGSQSMEGPSAYSDVAKSLLDSLRVDVDGFDQAFDHDFYQRHGLGAQLYFDQATWGQDALVPAGFLLSSAMLDVNADAIRPEEALTRMPLSAGERSELENLLTVSTDSIPDVPFTDVIEYLTATSYETFLKKDVGVRSERLLAYLRTMTAGYFGVGTDAVPALYAMMFGLPGLNKTGIPGAPWMARQAVSLFTEPYIHHFPDGNASIARGLVRSLIPEVAASGTAADLLQTPFDYSQLDREAHNVRIRLSSTALHAANTADGVNVRYSRGGRIYEAQGKQAVLACYNMMIPHLCPELPGQQKAALKSLVKIPLVYSNVALRNWRSLKRAGAGVVFTPGRFHNYFMIDFPVSLGSYQFSRSEDDPVLLHFAAALTEPGLTPRDQHRAGRGRLLSTSFEDMELDIRQTLAGALGDFGFDPADDIAAITVNRWPHGYAFSYNPLFDPTYAPGEAQHEIGRARFGNIAIANSDAGARAYLDEAIDQAYRAVGELTG